MSTTTVPSFLIQDRVTILATPEHVGTRHANKTGVVISFENCRDESGNRYQLCNLKCEPGGEIVRGISSRALVSAGAKK
jgi:hypothetical protein